MRPIRVSYDKMVIMVSKLTLYKPKVQHVYNTSFLRRHVARFKVNYVWALKFQDENKIQITVLRHTFIF